MKRKGLIFFLIILGLLVVSNDSFLEKVGLKTPAAGPLTGEEMMAINHELAAAGLTPPLLQRVTLEKIPDAEPMHDTRLVFSFDRPLTDEENRGFGTREIFKEPWHYSIAVRGRHELAEFRPIHTQSIRQYGDEQGSPLELYFYETTLHPKPFRMPREFAAYADATFQPGGIENFQLCLYRWKGYTDREDKTENLELVAEWNLKDLDAVSETEWTVPEDFDPNPSEEALQFYRDEMNQFQAP